MFDWLLRLLGLVEDVAYLFRCILCRIEEELTIADAKKKGWRYKQGWRCPRCA